MAFVSLNQGFLGIASGGRYNHQNESAQRQRNDHVV